MSTVPEYLKYNEDEYYHRGMVKYTSRDYESIMEDFLDMVPKLTELWMPASDKYLKENVDDMLIILRDAHILETPQQGQTLYVHLFKDLNRAYVGRTGTYLKIRSGSDGNMYKSHNLEFYQAASGEGWDNLYHIVIASGLSYKDAVYCEKLVIQLLRLSGYYLFNKNKGSGGPIHHTEESKKLISEAGKGRILSIESRKKIGDKNKGRIRSDHTKQLQKEAMKRYWTDERKEQHKERCKEFNQSRIGTHLSGDTKQKISSKLKGRKFTDDWRYKISESLKGNVPANAKKVSVTFQDGHVQIFESTASCDRFLQKYSGFTSQQCKNNKIVGGMKFEYV